MGLPKITVNRGKGGLGRPLAGKDHISAFLMPFVNANLPSGFSTTDRIKIVYSISEAQDLGITEAGTYTKTLWYHLNQYFKRQPAGKLYVHLIDSTAITYGEHNTTQNFANGEIRLAGYFDPTTTFATGTLNTLQTTCTALETANKPMSIVYAGNTQGIATIGAFVDLRALSNKNVSVVIGEDGNASGKALAIATGKSVTCLGSVLGALSLAKVHENIGWIEKFNMVDGLEFDEPALSFTASTVLVKNQTPSALDDLEAKGYIFLYKQTGSDGTFVSGTPTAISLTSDYATIENNRTIDKAVRNVRAQMLPNINAPLYVNADGTLSENTISIFKNSAETPLEQMEIDGELSQFKVVINPLQNVLSTSKISLALTLVPVGVAKEIEINIGFAVSL